MPEKVWLVTGCSSGIGREIASNSLMRGYSTVVTARNPTQVEDLAAGRNNSALVLPLDVTDPADRSAAVEATLDRFGRLDVLVNNAGIGYLGSFEATELDEARDLFEVNLWGLVGMTRAVLPTMRSAKSGTIVNISSVGGVVGYPGASFYCASKFAVSGLSEAMAHELEPLGINVIVVEPSALRTQWAASAREVSREIDEYSESAGALHRLLKGCSSAQAGDPLLAAAAIVEAVEQRNPPRRLLLGRWALEETQRKTATLQRQCIEQAELASSIDAPP
jgi:NAD(P)-dependent dehydrogenase (short-subunit alcohol dehydrogenase family)